jgi:SAM-dependent methyltransferase
LHIDDSNPQATLVADLTMSNDLPTEAFDCIVCTHVLHVIYEVEKVIGELHRILRPDGVLLIAVPHISMQDPREGELWRFTPEGLRRALASAFLPDAITVHAYGNSLTAAGDLRGVVASEFAPDELSAHDPWFPVEVCARATKTGARDEIRPSRSSS